MPMLRSLMFVPGNQPKMLAGAARAKPDAFIPDMEDSVPDAEKANAREITAAHLGALAASGALVIPRLNSLATGLLYDDIAAVVGPHIYGVSVGKIDTATDIHRISAMLDAQERRVGIAPGMTTLLPWIETAKAIVNLYDICSASPRVVGAAFGAEDFTNDMGIERGEDESETFFARNAIAVAARAADVLALDTPYFGFRDPDGLRQNALAARRIGFKGKFAIHPAQVDIINEAFSPSAAEIERARRVVAAFDEAAARGRGSTSLDGQVVDVPVVKRAQAVLDAAAAMAGVGG